MEMLIVAAYDIAITSEGGTRRLNRVAKTCLRYGQRVQNSVFECLIDDLTFAKMRQELTALIDPELDSLRFYNLGTRYENKVIHIGVKEVQDLAGPLIL
jgi:CRISPR-associated protein Cas2